VCLPQLDHYPVTTYTLPDASDTHFNLVKTIFLGKVFGEDDSNSSFIPAHIFWKNGDVVKDIICVVL
jgi:hypothetical protein